MRAAQADMPPGAIVRMGDNFKEKMRNLRAMMMDGRLTPYKMICRKAG